MRDVSAHIKYRKMDRQIVHLDLDSFFISVERLKDSSLVGRPVIVGGTSDRGVISSCSYEAREFGLHSAMPIRLAKQLCPHGIYIKGDMESYSNYSKMVTEIIEAESPAVEKTSIDEHYIDITGMDKFYGSLKWTQELRKKIIKESGLPISFGLSVNKTVSKIATGESKPNGERYIENGTEKPFLAPLSIKKIPMIGDKTYTLLRNMGIERVHTIQQMPVEVMQRVLGENGLSIWKKANGIDNSPVIPYTEQKSMSTETTFDKDTTDVEELKRILISMVDQLAFDLRKQKRLTSCVTLKIRYSDFQTHTFQSKISYTASDHLITQKILELFNKNYSRRILVRLIGVRFTNMVNGQEQINMFEDTPAMLNLYAAIDKMRVRFGYTAVLKAITTPPCPPQTGRQAGTVGRVLKNKNLSVKK